MRTNAPKFVVWVVGVAFGVVGILAHFITIPVLSVYHFWLLVIGFVVLALSTILKGM